MQETNKDTRELLRQFDAHRTTRCDHTQILNNPSELSDYGHRWCLFCGRVENDLIIHFR